MPWKQTDPMSQRAKFVLALDEGAFSMTELCQRFHISRKTGYKWRDRFREGGLTALADRSRAPGHSPHRTVEALEEALVALRRQHPTWGARKLLVILAQRQPALVDQYGLPAASTVTDILHRHGLITPRRNRRRAHHPGASPLQATAPNDVWTADFKGEFRLGKGQYCYPLTVCDAYSRFLLACQARASTAHATAQPVFEQLFQRYGLPRVIRTDNGSPFASRALRGFSRLSAYFTKLGIGHDRIRPGHPQENGRHERMHRTLKAETTRPPEATMKAQQHRFDAFRLQYNTVRPHEALSMQTPASSYARSERRMPDRLAGPVYAGHMEVRRISHGGCFSWRGRHVFLTTVLCRDYVGLEEVEEGLWNVFFYDVLLARYDERRQRLYT